tara:strand:+ start:883 stop:1362 length:480 start_codon:yes stop_codon:yes gene_type:complete
MVETKFSKRLKGLLKLYNTSIKKAAYNVLCSSEWGMQDKMQSNLEKLQDFQILSFYMIMLEWKTYEQNTFYLANDDDGCPIIKYPSTVVEQPVDKKTLVECFIRYFDCKHHMNIEPLLKVMGIYPVGTNPEGTSYDYISDGPTDCDTNTIIIPIKDPRK